jgi:DNA polymerase IV
MRRPDQVERLYLDFDGFFASVEQQARPRLRDRAVGVIPFEGTDRTIIIACSREAKMQGVKNVMPLVEARALCPDIVLVPQSPDLYRRAHNALIAEISTVLPIDAVKSIDELTCRIESVSNPEELGRRIKLRITAHIGPWITCSIGIAANRQLAKMACKAGKWRDGRYGDGLMVWRPEEMPGPLLGVTPEHVPGIGARMARRLAAAGVVDMAGLLALASKQMRALWGSVTGERLWYALHGYDIQTPPSARGMYGHGRVLPPDHRSLEQARMASRLLVTKAARRLRRDGWRAGRLALWLSLQGAGSWGATVIANVIGERFDSLDAPRPYWKERRAHTIETAPTERVASDQDVERPGQRHPAAGLQARAGRGRCGAGKTECPLCARRGALRSLGYPRQRCTR